MLKSHFLEKKLLTIKSDGVYNVNIERVVKMIEYKIDVINELKKVGINTTTARNSGIFAQATMNKFKKLDTSISLDNLNRLCCVLEMQPRDIIKFIETEEDRTEILSKISDKKVENHIK